MAVVPSFFEKLVFLDLPLFELNVSLSNNTVKDALYKCLGQRWYVWALCASGCRIKTSVKYGKMLQTIVSETVPDATNCSRAEQDAA